MALLWKFLYIETLAIFDRRRGCQTQFWKRIIQGLFSPSLFKIGLVVSEIWKVGISILGESSYSWRLEDLLNTIFKEDHQRTICSDRYYAGPPAVILLKYGQSKAVRSQQDHCVHPQPKTEVWIPFCIFYMDLIFCAHVTGIMK
jgi:hypothetical protein